MALWDRVVEIANRAMDTEANQILQELRAECKAAYPNGTGTTAKSFHIMGKGESSDVSVGGKGLITKVRVGSTLESAYYANYGNSATDKFVAFVPNKGISESLRPKGTKKVYSHGRKGYEGAHFVEKVAARHGG